MSVALWLWDWARSGAAAEARMASTRGQGIEKSAERHDCWLSASTIVAAALA